MEARGDVGITDWTKCRGGGRPFSSQKSNLATSFHFSRTLAYLILLVSVVLLITRTENVWLQPGHKRKD